VKRITLAVFDLQIDEQRRRTLREKLENSRRVVRDMIVSNFAYNDMF